MEETIRLSRLLGKHLQETEAYQQMKRAEEAADQDAELQRMIGEFNVKRMNLNHLMSSETREENAKEKMEELNIAIQKQYGEIMLNPNMQLYSEAQGAVSEMMQQINTILTAAVNGQDPDLVDPSACGGDCASCGGCH